MARHEFSKSMRDVLAKRVSLRCSNPACRVTTTGPHSTPPAFVDLGVASHITAASPGGPRYDQVLTIEERTSLENAIWLCQRCAKLIDDDVLRYDIASLRRWKVAAEAEALRAINGSFVPEFFPQPVSAVHTPIPRIPGLTYDEARELLLLSSPKYRRQKVRRRMTEPSADRVALCAAGYQPEFGASRQHGAGHVPHRCA